MQKDKLAHFLESLTNCPPVLVVGDVGVDKYTYGIVDRISPEAPVPILEVTKEWYKLGLAANVTDNLHGLGVATTLSGIIGEDNYGNLFEELLEDVGLKTWGMIRTKDRQTTLKERVTTQVQQICRIDYESYHPINIEVQKKVLKRADQFVKDHDSIIIQDYGKGLFNEKVCQTFIQKFKALNKRVVIDPSRFTNPLFYKGATLIKPNFKEAQIIGEQLGVEEIQDVEKLIEAITTKLDIDQVLITLGKDGMAIFDRNSDSKTSYISTVANEVFDVSGAGDTVVSVVTAALSLGCSLNEAAYIGNLAAGVVVGKKGTARVSRDEITQMALQAQ